MSKYKSPGVYSKVTNISQIASLATSTVFAVVTQASRGPVGTRYMGNGKQVVNTYGNPDQGRGLGLWGALMVAEQGGSCWVNNVAGDNATYAMINAALNVVDSDVDYVLSDVADVDAVAWAAGDLFRIAAVGPGPFYENIGVRIVNVDTVKKQATVNVYQKSAPAIVVESFVVSFRDQLTAGGVQLFAEDIINGNSQYINFYVAPSVADGTTDVFTYLQNQTVNQYLSGGEAGDDLTEAQIIAGWEEFTNVNKYDVTVLINAGATADGIRTAMLGVAQQRDDAYCLLDLPAGTKTAENAVTDRTTLAQFSRWGGLYGPRFLRYSQYEGRNIYLPASIGVAAAVAYSDSVKEPWWAFAGWNRGRIPGALGLEADWEQSDQDLMYPQSINAIINDSGIVLNGNRTLLQDDSSLWSTNVHRCVCAIVKSCRAFLKTQLFEQNDQFLGRTIVATITKMLAAVKAGRGLYQFKVVSDGTNTSNLDIDQGIRNVDVYLQPTRSAEIIVLNAILTPTGASFEVSSTTDASVLS